MGCPWRPRYRLANDTHFSASCARVMSSFYHLAIWYRGCRCGGCPWARIGRTEMCPLYYVLDRNLVWRAKETDLSRDQGRSNRVQTSLRFFVSSPCFQGRVLPCFSTFPKVPRFLWISDLLSTNSNSPIEDLKYNDRWPQGWKNSCQI